MAKKVIYLAHPVRGDTAKNLETARWWLRFLFHADPGTVYIAPWIGEVSAFEEISAADNPEIVQKALEDDCDVVLHCDGLLLVGGRVSAGMAIERGAAEGGTKPVVDWSQYRTPLEVPQGVVPCWNQLTA